MVQSQEKDAAPLDGTPVKEAADLDAMAKRVAGTNINPTTLLATDYLNHFNEVVMTLELVPDMPEILEEAKGWRPKSYEDHFRDSMIADRALALEVYGAVPARFRDPFDQTVAQLNRLIIATIERLQEDLDEGRKDKARAGAEGACRLMHRLLDHASATIHGNESTMDQMEIDAFLGA